MKLLIILYFSSVFVLLDTSFGAFTAMKLQVEVFWVIAPCRVLVRYQRFRGPRCLHILFEV